MKRKFWNFVHDGDTHVLRLEGTIGDGDLWLEENDTAKIFKAELDACNGEDITVQINSYGGDCLAASTIYADLKNYPGKVDVEIILAASAASVVAMAGDRVGIFPTGSILLHNPFTLACGDSDEMTKAARMLDSVKETIINAYQLKTGLPRAKLAEMMTAETWLSARAALELKFVDQILFTGNQNQLTDAVIFSERQYMNRLINKISGNTEISNKKIGEVKHMTHDLEHTSINPAILPNPNDPEFSQFRLDVPQNSYKKFGVEGAEYRARFFEQFRTGFKNALNYLQIANPVEGGYLVPTEFHQEIITALAEENVLRHISRNITTATEHKIIIQATAPAANFVAEGQAINLSAETFSQKTLSAYKLACGVSVSNELLADSYYNIEEHLIIEFTKAIGAKEEDSFLNGTGVKEPTGILTTVANDSSTMLIQTSGTTITADDVINLTYQLKRPYRKNAAFLMNDSTLAEIRKLKDSTLNYLWQPNFATNEPPQIMGFPVYTSEYMPASASGKIPVLFGDFTRFIIGQRGEFVFQPLYELHALQGLTTYLMTERVDAVLSDNQAIRGLKIK